MSQSTVDDQLNRLSSWIKESESTIVLTGAGMSTESGIPDFRSANGVWQKIDPKKVATPQALENYYSDFHSFYSKRIDDLEDVQPHLGHYALAELEKEGLVDGIITQNVDGLHQKAGSEKVYEIHGSLKKIHCNNCGMPTQLSLFKEKAECPNCTGPLRPGVVLFGEPLPEEILNKSLLEVQQADLMIVIGTSLEVAPVNQLPYMTNGRVVLLNNERTFNDSIFDMVIIGKAGPLLKELKNIIDD